MTASEEFLNIDTPENVIFGYEVAGIGSRFLAALVDTTLIFVLLIISTLGILFFTALVADLESILIGTAENGPLLMIAFISLLNFFFLWGYYLLFEVWWNGQTPGKRAIGIRVIRTDGTPIDLSESIIRNLVRIVDFLPGYYVIGFITMFASQQSRRLGDYAAGTLVIYDKGDVSLDSLKQANTAQRIRYIAAKHESHIAGLALERLTDQDIQLAENYLLRRLELKETVNIGNQIANTLLERMGAPPRQLAAWEVTDLLEAIVAASYNKESNL